VTAEAGGKGGVDVIKQLCELFAGPAWSWRDCQTRVDCQC